MPSEWDQIDGETPVDLSQLINRAAIRTRHDLNVAEAENIRRPFGKYLSRKPPKHSARFDYGWFLQLHREMFCDVWAYAGELRDADLNIGVHWTTIPERLANLIADLHCWSQYSMPLEEQAVRLHHLAVQIHPFSGGNGRWSRLLSNIWLKQNGGEIVIWPEATIGSESVIRADYIRAIQAADGGDYEPLISIQKDHTQRPGSRLRPRS